MASNSAYNVIKDDLKPVYEEKRIKSQINYSTVKYNLSYSGIHNHNIDFPDLIFRNRP